MFKIGGELGVNVKDIKRDKDIVRPYHSSCRNPMDLSLLTDDNDWLHICGNNDWGYLALEILKPILQTGIKLNSEICDQISEKNPEVIVVGRNDYRILDILHTARDSEKGISMLRGVPIVMGYFDNGFKCLGNKEREADLPF